MARTIAAIGAISIWAFTAGAAYAEDVTDKYVYYPDGTYSREGETPTDGVPSFAAFVESSVGLASQSSGTNTVLGLRGSVGTSFLDSIYVQADLNYREALSGSKLAGSSMFGMLHASYRATDTIAVGGFTRYGQIDISGVSNQIESSTYGVEAAYLLDQATIFARVGQLTESRGSTEADGTVFTGGANYYANDNLRFDVEATSADGFTSGMLAANYRGVLYDGTVFGGYKMTDTEGSEDMGHYFFAGYRMNFGSTSLKSERDAGLIWTSID